jgi:hypothetical protein
MYISGPAKATTILTSSFTRNIASDRGGGVYVDFKTNFLLRFEDNLFLTNEVESSDSGGGAMYLAATGDPAIDFQVENSSFGKSRVASKIGYDILAQDYLYNSLSHKTNFKDTTSSSKAPRFSFESKSAPTGDDELLPSLFMWTMDFIVISVILIIAAIAVLAVIILLVFVAMYTKNLKKKKLANKKSELSTEG